MNFGRTRANSIIHLSILAWLLALTSTSSATRPDASASASSSSPSASVFGSEHNLNPTIVELLDAKLSRRQFMKEMRVFSSDRQVEFHSHSVSTMQKLYESVVQFDAPCSVRALECFSNAFLFKDAIVDKEVRKVIHKLLEGDSNLRYAQKCIDEIDAFAQRYFSDGENANLLAAKLVTALSQESLEDLESQLISADLNLLSSGSKAFRSIIFRQEFYLVCKDKINERHLGGRFAMTEMIVRNNSSLRSPQLTARLKAQIFEQPQNAMKMLILRMFCRNFII